MFRAVFAGICQALLWPFILLISGLRRRLAFRRCATLLQITAKNAQMFGVGGKGLEQLRRLSHDVELRTLALDISHLPSGWAALEELRNLLLEIKSKNKRILVFLKHPTRESLYVGSVGNKVWILPAGAILFHGIGGRMRFYGSLFKRLGIMADVEAAGEFKSAGEPFSRSFPSTPNREQIQTLFDDLQNNIVNAIADSRGLEPSAVVKAMTQSPLSPQRAIDLGLVDEAIYDDAFIPAIQAFDHTEEKPISFKWYDRLMRWELFLHNLCENKETIAVLHLTGAVVDGEGPAIKIQADKVIKQLKYLSQEEKVVAVVLAVDSPGGSALASDRIGRAVELLGRDKPVVSSFGNVSASGGYYIAAFSHEIVALPNTITGSIGVVGGKVVAGPAFESVGVRSELISAGPDADFFSSWSRFNDDQRVRFRAFLRHTYDRFIDVVSGGRRMPKAAVEEIAEGRVWTGRQAMSHGLVDRLGGLDLAIERACVRANRPLEQVKVIHLKQRPSFWSRYTRVGAATPSFSSLLLAEAPPFIQILWHNPLKELMMMPWALDDFHD